MLPGAVVGQIPMLVDSCPIQPLTHILHLEVEFLLEVVDGGGARFDVLAQGGAAGDNAAEASGSVSAPHSSPRQPPTAAPAPLPPIVGAVGGVGHGGVGAVRDEPLAGAERAQADGRPLGAGHVGAVSVEIAQKDYVLRARVLCPCSCTLQGSEGSLKS